MLKAPGIFYAPIGRRTVEAAPGFVARMALSLERHSSLADPNNIVSRARRLSFRSELVSDKTILVDKRPETNTHAWVFHNRIPEAGKRKMSRDLDWMDLELFPVPTVLVDDQGAILQANQKLAELFGYQTQELESQPIEILVPHEIRPQHPLLREAYFQAPVKREMGTGRDLHGLRKDGTQVPVEVGLNPILHNGRPVVMVTVVDIRQRKKNEDLIRRALDAAATAMVQIDRHGEIELVNEMACRLFGYQRHELLGLKVEILVPESVRLPHVVYRNSFLANPEKREMGHGRDLFAVRKDGSEFPVEIGLTPIPNAEHQSVMATIIDITERKAWQSQIEAQNARLAHTNSELLQFASTASHELKSPLASIKGLLSLCQSDIEDGEPGEALENIQRAQSLASMLAQRIENLLALAKADSSIPQIDDYHFAERLAQTWTVLNAPSVELEVKLSGSPYLRTVAERMDSILQNLLSNAIKYQRFDVENKRIVVRSWHAGNDFCFSVEDNGQGIPTQYHSSVFKLFQRFANQQASGSGIGLALVKKNVVQLGGSITFESREGRTIFEIRLPK